MSDGLATQWEVPSDIHLSLVLYSSSDMASPGDSGASVGPHSGDN
jgi:hypothetical protein